MQLFLVMVVPSRAPRTVLAGPLGTNGGAALGSAGGTATVGGGGSSALGTGGGGGAGFDTGAGGGAGGGTVGTSGGGVSVNGNQAVLPGGQTVKGDTSHCVNGMQLGGVDRPPPCVPTFTGDNGGATSPGVTADTIEVIYYRAQANAVVDDVLKTQGLYASPQDEGAFVETATTFINKYWEFYKRKIHLDYVTGNCAYAPPDVACLRTEASALVAKYHPFAIIWATSVAPEFFDAYSKLGVINMGGWHFDDSFNTAHRPYHYDVFMGGTVQADFAGEFWCKELAGRPARYAGDPILKTKTRKVAILVPETPINKSTADTLLRIIQGCDHNGPEEVVYSSDTSTAVEQSTAQVAKLKGDGVTSVMCFCDPIAPSFFTKQASAQGYFPEYPMVGNGLIDYDVLGRLYDPAQWVHAFGLSDLALSKPFAQTDASVAWRGGGGAGQQPNDNGANLPWSYLNLLADGINDAGPNLNPLTFEQSVLSLPPSGGWSRTHNPTLSLIQFGPGHYAGLADVREVYWSPTATSTIDGKAGAYVGIDGGERWTLGQLPSGEPSFPSST